MEQVIATPVQACGAVRRQDGVRYFAIGIVDVLLSVAMGVVGVRRAAARQPDIPAGRSALSWSGLSLDIDLTVAKSHSSRSGGDVATFLPAFCCRLLYAVDHMPVAAGVPPWARRATTSPR